MSADNDYVIETTPGYLVHAAQTIPVLHVQSATQKVVVVATGGLPGKTGPRGQDGPAGPAGGDQGEVGPPGQDGVDGAPGVDGVDGAPGVDGVDGAPGEPGPPGLRGTAGVIGTWQDSWRSDQAYVETDLVFYDGSSWVAVRDTAAGELPGTFGHSAVIPAEFIGSWFDGDVEATDPTDPAAGDALADQYGIEMVSDGQIHIAVAQQGTSDSSLPYGKNVTLLLENQNGDFIDFVSGTANCVLTTEIPAGHYFVSVAMADDPPFPYSILFETTTGEMVPWGRDATTTPWDIVAQRGDDGPPGADGSPSENAGHRIFINDTELTARPILEFTDQGVAVTDDEENGRTVVHIPWPRWFDRDFPPALLPQRFSAITSGDFLVAQDDPVNLRTVIASPTWQQAANEIGPLLPAEASRASKWIPLRLDPDTWEDADASTSPDPRDFAPPSLRLAPNGWCHMRGRVRSTSIAALICTIPKMFCPGFIVYVPIAGANLRIQPDGKVYLDGVVNEIGDTFSLEGFSYEIGQGDPGKLTFPTAVFPWQIDGSDPPIVAYGLGKTGFYDFNVLGSVIGFSNVTGSSFPILEVDKGDWAPTSAGAMNFRSSTYEVLDGPNIGQTGEVFGDQNWISGLNPFDVWIDGYDPVIDPPANIRVTFEVGYSYDT